MFKITKLQSRFSGLFKYCCNDAARRSIETLSTQNRIEGGALADLA